MSKIIRWGILGTGAVARRFAEGLVHAPGAQLLAVGSRTRAGAQAFAADLGAARAYGSYEALVADADVDVVYIATPNTLHREHALLCFDHGKAVLCEKPFTLDAAEARSVVAVARRKRLFCMEAMWMRFSPLMKEVDALLRRGALGDLRMISVQLGHSFEPSATHRVFRPDLGGGALLDLGVYPISLAHQLLGRPTRIVSDTVVGATGVDEQVSAILGYPDGRQAILSASIRNRTTNEAVLMGTHGTMRLHEPLYRPEVLSLSQSPPEGAAPQARARRNPHLTRVAQHPWIRELASRVSSLRTRSLARRTPGNGYDHEAVEVMRCLREGATESRIMPLEETIAVLETMDAIRGQIAMRKTA
jgi:predicted dehydrogenase